MRKTSVKNDKKQLKMTTGGKRHVSFEWPLLIYPALFLATLMILHVVGRSIENETASPPEPQRAVERPASTLDRTGQADQTIDIVEGHAVLVAPGLGPHSPGSTEAAAVDENPSAAPRDDRGTNQPGRSPTVAGKMRHAVDLSLLKGSARTTALLCIAVDEKDHTRIKQCLAELVAMGDEAVVPLRDLLANEEGEAALWAATALARIGTPAAAGALLDRLAQTEEGRYKEELSKRASNISNHDSWPLLLDIMLQANDGAVVRAAGAALSTIADAPVIDEVIARYDAASSTTEVDRLAQFVRGIRSSKATESLLSLAGPVSSAPQDSLQEAAIEALARVGDAQSISYLLRRLEASASGESGPIFDTIARIDSPEAQTSLLYAAAGNKEVSAEHGRTAAIYALKNYPDERTVALLERIVAQEQNEKVLTAATRTLDDIRRSPYTVTARADSLQKSEEMLPLTPLEK
jgi:HEAT repeat protein